MNLEISEEIQPLVEDMRNVEKRNRLFMKDRYLPEAYECLDESIKAVNERAEEVDPQTEYDELVVRDIEANVDSIQKYTEFFLSSSFEDHDGLEDDIITVEELFDNYYGKGSFECLKDEVMSFDGKSRYEAEEMRDDLELDRPDEYRSDIVPMLEQVLDAVTEYSKENSLMPEAFEYEKSFIPAHVPRKGQRASWEGKFNRVNLSAESGVYVIRDNGDLDIDLTSPIFTMFHELVGHGVHQWNSSQLQYPETPDNVMNRPPGLGHMEGVSQHREELAKGFIEKHKDELPVREEGMKLRQINSENKDYRAIYTSLVRSMHKNDEISEDEMRERIDDAYREGMAERVLADNNLSFTKALKEGSYTAGNRLMEEVNASDRDPLATSTGVWHPRVFSDAVDFFEKEVNQR